MKFCYRGIIYDKQIPSLEITEGEIMGKYRGSPWCSRRLVTVAQKSLVSKNPLKYRGNVYGVSKIKFLINKY